VQTNFTAEQLKDPKLAEADRILRACVHCGFCLATCPTYVLLGDELDSPRGRIYLIKDMLENDKPATAEVAKHIDRCLSCLACVTTCPSGVDYMHLIDQGRAHVEKTYRRPVLDRLMRRLVGHILPEPARLRAALRLARLAKPVSGFFKAFPRIKAMLDLAPDRLPAREPLGEPGVKLPAGERRGRVILLAGCAQGVLDPAINAATVRLLTRLGIEVVIPARAGCCGALTHHLGQEADGRTRAQALIEVWAEAETQGAIDAIIINTSGCGTMVKDYGHMFARDPAYREKAARVAGLAKDISEYLHNIAFEAHAPERLRVAYHSACSMQHGQKITREPKALLARAGFEVVEPAEGHLCCGSAGTYNILQPEIAAALKQRKLRNIEATRPQVIATGNIGCMTQLGGGTIPVVHTVELLDWATGGPRPFGNHAKLDRRNEAAKRIPA
jgi:glycolate oxidase iron-sulfur subunit